jgi:hypothetical protein
MKQPMQDFHAWLSRRLRILVIPLQAFVAYKHAGGILANV